MNPPGLDNVDGHGGGRGHQPADHAGAEVAQDVVTEMPWGHPKTSKGNGERVHHDLGFPHGRPTPLNSPESSKNCLDWEYEASWAALTTTARAMVGIQP